MLRLPALNRRTRLIAVVYGLLLFLWLSPEDNQVWPVALLGNGLAALLVARAVLVNLGGREIPARYVLPGAALLGGLTGLGGSVATALLMFFKNALHAHLFLDYPPGLLLAILQRAPGWALAGALAGFGLALLWRARR